MKTYKIKITGMHCTSCAMLLEGEADDMDGVDEANCNYAKGILQIKSDDENIVEHVIKMIEKNGYKGGLYE